MSGRKTTNHVISGAFVFLLLGIFAVFSTVMVLLGARAYRATAERTDSHNQMRIANAYVRSMVRADDEAGVLQVETLDGMQALTMTNVYDDEAYITRIYCYEGELKELFTDAELEFDPENGETVCEMDSLEATLDGQLLRVTLKRGDTANEVVVALCAAEPEQAE